LQRWLCVSTRFNISVAGVCVVSWWHLQCVRRDVVYELQCGVRMSTRLDVVDARSSHVYCREVQRGRRDVVQQL
jgi:hypothetical protein